MRGPALKIFFLIACAFSFALASRCAFAQNDDVESRIGEIREMVIEEQNTISLLEAQLKSAIDDGDDKRAAQIRREISNAHDSLEKLEELEKKLRDMLGEDQRSNGNRGRAGVGGKRRKDVPNPSLGGGLLTDTGEVVGGNRNRNSRRRGSRRSREDDSTSSKSSSKLRHLRDAFDSLIDANELELAEQVNRRIKIEERKLESDRSSGRSRSRGNSRGKGSDRSSAKDDEIDELQDSLDRLKERLKQLEEAKGGG